MVLFLIVAPGTFSKLKLLVSAAIYVSKKEIWRRSTIWEHVRYFASLTKLEITSPIIVIVVGSEEAAVSAHRFPLASSKFSLNYTYYTYRHSHLLMFIMLPYLKLQASSKIWISCPTNTTTRCATQFF